MKYRGTIGCLLAACTLFGACTSTEEQRAKIVGADSTKCMAARGGGTDSQEYLECMNRLAEERVQRRKAEEIRRAAENTWRVPLPIPSIDITY